MVSVGFFGVWKGSGTRGCQHIHVHSCRRPESTLQLGAEGQAAEPGLRPKRRSTKSQAEAMRKVSGWSWNAPLRPNCPSSQNKTSNQNYPRIRPKTQASEGKRQSGPSLGTPRGRGGKDKIKSVLKYSWGDADNGGALQQEDSHLKLHRKSSIPGLPAR